MIIILKKKVKGFLENHGWMKNSSSYIEKTT
jgi:hypothetical protein